MLGYCCPNNNSLLSWSENGAEAQLATATVVPLCDGQLEDSAKQNEVAIAKRYGQTNSHTTRTVPRQFIMCLSPYKDVLWPCHAILGSPACLRNLIKLVWIITYSE